MNWVARTAAALIAAHLLIRAILAFGGYFYWDDLILIGRAGTQELLSPSFLFDDHDGHVMPGAFLVAGGISRVAPLNWIGPAISLVVLQLLASLALLRALRVILGWRPVLLLPLVFALFTPLAVPGFAWWAAALNSLPMLVALAWVCADALLLVRTGNQRYALTAVVVYLGGLLFFEKSAVIPFVAFTVATLLAYVAGDRSALITVWRRGFRLWVSSLALTAAWIVVYLIVVDQKRWSFDVVMTWDLLSRSITHGIVSGLVGGPWGWQRWAPASPWATPPVAVMVLGWIVLAAVLAVSLIRKQRVWPVWLVAAGYAVACQIPIYLMRSSRFTALELAQTLRYLPDLVVVLALLLAVVLPVSVVAACAIVVITLWIRRRRHVRVRRRAAESAALQGALDVVVGELRVGAHPAAAFGVAAGEIDGVVPASLRAVAARARLGADVPAGLHSMTRRSSMPAHWGRLAVCWQLPRITGWRSRR